MGTAAITGTVTESVNETAIVNGAKTLIITLTGDTWIGSSVASGTVGQTAWNNNGVTLPSTSAFFTRSTVGAGNGGTVRYGHIHMNGLSGTQTICLSLQQDTDGGTVYLYATAVASGDSAWLNIDMGSTYTVVEGVTYRLVVQTNANTYIDYSSTFGSTPDVRNDTVWTYSPGASVTNDGQFANRTMPICFNNTAGDPS